jgi:hypothetical protein
MIRVSRRSWRKRKRGLGNDKKKRLKGLLRKRHRGSSLSWSRCSGKGRRISAT